MQGLLHLETIGCSSRIFCICHSNRSINFTQSSSCPQVVHKANKLHKCVPQLLVCNPSGDDFPCQAAFFHCFSTVCFHVCFRHQGLHLSSAAQHKAVLEWDSASEGIQYICPTVMYIFRGSIMTMSWSEKFNRTQCPDLMK